MTDRGGAGTGTGAEATAGESNDRRADAGTTPGTDASDELERALRFLDWEVDRETVVTGGGRVGVAVGLCAALLGSAVGGVAAGILAGTAIGLLVVHVIHRLPVWLASLRRTRALGAAPGLVGRMVLRMRLDPSPERAVGFAANTGDGPLADALERHARRATGGPTAGLRAFVREWRPWFPALDRAAALIRTAGAAPAERRGRCLDRALDAVVSGTTDRMASFVGDVRAPVSALCAFGVLLPLALVALLPAAGAAGVPIGPRAVAIGYLGVLPALLVGASAWLLARRPVAFPPPAIDATHPDVPRRWPHALVLGTLLGAATGLLVSRLVAAWAAPVAGVGAGVGAALLIVAHPRRRVLTEVRAVEAGLPDAMTVTGGNVAEGVAVKRAVASAGERLDGATGAVFAAAGDRSRTLRVGVHEAFLGPGGPLEHLPSSRGRGAVMLLAIAAREGKPAGDVLLELADQLETLRELERDARRQLASVTGTLANTAAVFGPLVGGATVALASNETVRLGTTEPVRFETGTLVAVAVSARPPGVGDVDGTRDETSGAWPCPETAAAERRDDECSPSG